MSFFINFENEYPYILESNWEILGIWNFTDEIVGSFCEYGGVVDVHIDFDGLLPVFAQNDFCKFAESVPATWFVDVLVQEKESLSLVSVHQKIEGDK